MRKSIPTQDARNRFPFTPEPKGAFSTEKKEKEGEGGGDAGFTRNSPDMARAGFAKRAE